MKSLLAAAIALAAATPAAADWSPGRAPASRGWYPDTAFPSTPPIQRYGKGNKGVRRFGYGLARDAEFKRFQQDAIAIRPAAAGMEDSRGRCDRRLKAALDSGDQAELEAAREYCKPKAYGPQLR
jgi:hypothetical protein